MFYLIHGETVTAYPSASAVITEPDLLIGSAEEIETCALSKAQLAAIWNALPGTVEIARFKDRKVAAQRLWAAFAQLPVEPLPASDAPGARAGSKQAQVVALLGRAQGATVEEIATAMGWQHHTVRGLISGALKKKLRLAVVSEKTERGRVYRIPAAA